MKWLPYSFWGPCRTLESPIHARWQKLCKGTKGLCQKVWTRTKLLSPNIRCFVAILRFVAIYALFGNIWQKSVFLGKNHTITWYILYIKLSWICKLAIMGKNDAFVAKIVNTCLTKTFMGIFALAERLPISATLVIGKLVVHWEPSYTPCWGHPRLERL